MRLLLLALLAQANIAVADQLLGFDEASSDAQHNIETQLDASIDAKEMDEWLRLLSTMPHHAGSLAGKENAEFIAELLKSWGYEVEIAEYQVLLLICATNCTTLAFNIDPDCELKTKTIQLDGYN